ncbi:hypothetical protein ACHAWF_014158 [Thalassiosira exigua]
MSTSESESPATKKFRPTTKAEAAGEAEADSESESASSLHDGTTAGALGVDELAVVFGFLSWRDIPSARVCRKWKEAATITDVPFAGFDRHVAEPLINNARKFQALYLMVRALPNLRQVRIVGEGLAFEDGEDPEPLLSSPLHDISIVSHFSKLSSLILANTRLNGRYPSLFGFPHLRHLYISGVRGESLKFDLDVLCRSPMLEELELRNLRHLRGDLRSLRPLRERLRSVTIYNADNVRGNFMELADFTLLHTLHLDITSVEGDVCALGIRDFPALRLLRLPYQVQGFGDIQRVSDAPPITNALCRLLKRGVALCEPGCTSYYPVDLAADSADRYERDVFRFIHPPLLLHTVRAGPRLGWCWTNGDPKGCCEINWIDPPPDSHDKKKSWYLRELEHVEKDVVIFRGFHKPPTQVEYNDMFQPHW